MIITLEEKIGNMSNMKVFEILEYYVVLVIFMKIFSSPQSQDKL